MQMFRFAAAAALVATFSVPASAGVPLPVNDHLQCIKIKDSIAKAAYATDLTPEDLTIDPSTGCTVKMGAKYLCVDVTRTNTTPSVPYFPNAQPARKYLCYKTKCPVSPAVAATISDPFGSHPVASKTTGLLCAPASTPPSCDNGLEDGSETDVDCGGSCTEDCANGQFCVADTDCQSDYCYGGECTVPSCSDGVWNGSETATDCGGGCPGCGNGLLCNIDSDCQSSYCNPITDLCASPSCSDGLQNGNESDVDCGGSCGNTCLTGDTCGAASDCQSFVCSAGACQAPSCSDGVQNGSETDLDCGGSCGPTCSFGESCSSGADCNTLLCLSGQCF